MFSCAFCIFLICQFDGHSGVFISCIKCRKTVQGLTESPDETLNGVQKLFSMVEFDSFMCLNNVLMYNFHYSLVSVINIFRQECRRFLVPNMIKFLARVKKSVELCCI